MTLKDLSTRIKNEFNEISSAFFDQSLNISYVKSTDRIFGEGGPMFGANIVKYSESNFQYFYIYNKYLISNLDIVHLRVLKSNFKRLDTKEDLLSLDFIKQAVDSDEAVVKTALFYELNFISNLFVFFHECGHLNQIIPTDQENIKTNHFSEFNSDYYALSKILNYYYTLRKKYAEIYLKKTAVFTNEHNLIRCVIVTSLIVIYFECLSNPDKTDTVSHPAIKKRFCYLIYQMQIKLETNFDFLFTHNKLSDFLVDIFNTLDFLESKIFIKDSFVFSDILGYCVSCLDEVKESMKASEKFDQFNR